MKFQGMDLRLNSIFIRECKPKPGNSGLGQPIKESTFRKEEKDGATRADRERVLFSLLAFRSDHKSVRAIAPQ